MIIVPIYTVTKTAMTETLDEHLLQILGISVVEVTRISQDKGT